MSIAEFSKAESGPTPGFTTTHPQMIRLRIKRLSDQLRGQDSASPDDQAGATAVVSKGGVKREAKSSRSEEDPWAPAGNDEEGEAARAAVAFSSSGAQGVYAPDEAPRGKLRKRRREIGREGEEFAFIDAGVCRAFWMGRSRFGAWCMYYHEVS